MIMMVKTPGSQKGFPAAAAEEAEGRGGGKGEEECNRVGNANRLRAWVLRFFACSWSPAAGFFKSSGLQRPFCEQETGRLRRRVSLPHGELGITVVVCCVFYVLYLLIGEDLYR